MTPITYRTGNDLDLDAVIELYRASTLGERRPVDDRARMAAMLRQANLVITAWDGDLLVGIARSLSDHSFVTYLSDLAVRESHQHRGHRARVDPAHSIGGWWCADRPALSTAGGRVLSTSRLRDA